MIPPITDRLESELADFAEAGIHLTSAEIICLSKACDALDNPFADVDARLIDAPFKAGNKYLWPLSVGSSVWLDTYASQWWGGSDELYFWALVYALTNARDAAAFVTCEDEAFRAVKKIGIGFACTRKELEHAVDCAIGVDKDLTAQKKKRRESASIAWNTVVSELEVHSGINRHEWLWGRSVLSTADSYASMYAVAAAMAGSGQSRMNDALDKAIGNLALIKKEIRLNHA